MKEGTVPKIVIKSEEQRLVFAEVYAPMHVDTDGEAMTAAEIQKMAHDFLARGITSKVDVQHSKEESGCTVVESFLARKDDPDGFVLGSWVVGVHILPNDLWEDVKKGELNGFSFAAAVQSSIRKMPVTTTRRITGSTELAKSVSVEEHYHEIDIMLTQEGKVVPGLTRIYKGHIHPVMQATATRKERDHSHRIILIENDKE